MGFEIIEKGVHEGFSIGSGSWVDGADVRVDTVQNHEEDSEKTTCRFSHKGAAVSKEKQNVVCNEILCHLCKMTCRFQGLDFSKKKKKKF